MLADGTQKHVGYDLATTLNASALIIAISDAQVNRAYTTMIVMWLQQQPLPSFCIIIHITNCHNCHPM